MGFPGGTVVKNLPADTGGARDAGLISGSGISLEKEVAAHFIILAWKIPCTEEPGKLQSTGSQRARHDWAQYSTASASCNLLTFLPGVNYLERGQQLSQDVRSLFFPPTLHSLGHLNSPTRIELGPSEMKVWSPNHWTSREFWMCLLYVKNIDLHDLVKLPFKLFQFIAFFPIRMLALQGQRLHFAYYWLLCLELYLADIKQLISIWCLIHLLMMLILRTCCPASNVGGFSDIDFII